MKNQFIIKTEKDLNNFLKIIAEESYKKTIRENSYSDSYRSQFEQDSKLYNLSEQEEEEPNEDDLDQEGEALITSDQENEENEEDDPGSDIPTVSFEAIKSAINDLRASKSLKNQDASDSLSAFYEKIDDNEKLVLLSYLNTLTDILNLDGKGQDPSDPPINITMSSSEDIADQEAEEDAEQTEPVTDEEEPVADEEEDTSPPIELAERKNPYSNEIFRRKIRALML